MLIKTVRLINYRCFQDSGEIPLQGFSLLIGKNDGGKSSFLYALQKLFEQKETFSPQDCWKDTEDNLSPELEVRVRLEDEDGNEVHIRAIYECNGETHREVEDECVGDPTLDQDFGQLSLNVLKDLCVRHMIDAKGPQNRKDTFIEALVAHRNTLPKELGWKPLPSEIINQLPRVYLYESINDVGI